jgi:hypothetical protein
MSRHLRQPWERLPDEGDEMHRLFRMFLSLDPPRRLGQVAKLSGRSVGTIQQYSKRFQWFARAAAYDEDQRRRFDKAAARTAERLGEEHMEAAKFLRDLGLGELNRRARKLRQKQEARDAQGRPADDLEPVISDRDALKMATEGIKLERLVTGQATERLAVEEPWDLSKLTDEEIAFLKTLREKATS